MKKQDKWECRFSTGNGFFGVWRGADGQGFEALVRGLADK